MGSSTTDIRERRIQAGLTQEQLAVYAGTTAKTVASVERGASAQRTTLAAIEAALTEAEAGAAA